MLREDRFRQLFRIGIFLKALDGVLEVGGGILLLVASKESLNDVVAFLTQHELAEDPHDLIANYLVHLVHHLSLSTQRFGALYLLVHGVLKVFLVVGLLLNQQNGGGAYEDSQDDCEDHHLPPVCCGLSESERCVPREREPRVSQPRRTAFGRERRPANRTCVRSEQLAM